MPRLCSHSILQLYVRLQSRALTKGLDSENCGRFSPKWAESAGSLCNDAPGQLWKVPNRTFRPFPLRLETRIKRGFPPFHSDDGGGLPGSDKDQSCQNRPLTENQLCFRGEFVPQQWLGTDEARRWSPLSLGAYPPLHPSPKGPNSIPANRTSRDVGK